MDAAVLSTRIASHSVESSASEPPLVSICVSSYIRSLVLGDAVDPEKVLTIPKRVRPQGNRRVSKPQLAQEDFAISTQPCPPGCLTVLTVSRLMDRKGIDGVSRQCLRLFASVPGTRYVDRWRWRRQGTPAWPRLQVARPKTPSRFLALSQGTRSFECYSRCDVFALPAREEGFVIVVPEANAFGKPVIGGRSGGEFPSCHNA